MYITPLAGVIFRDRVLYVGREYGQVRFYAERYSMEKESDFQLF